MSEPEREVVHGVEFEMGHEPVSPGLIAHVSLSVGAKHCAICLPPCEGCAWPAAPRTT